jgi:hypothetical protein
MNDARRPAGSRVKKNSLFLRARAWGWLQPGVRHSAIRSRYG